MLNHLIPNSTFYLVVVTTLVGATLDGNWALKKKSRRQLCTEQRNCQNGWLYKAISNEFLGACPKCNPTRVTNRYKKDITGNWVLKKNSRRGEADRRRLSGKFNKDGTPNKEWKANQEADKAAKQARLARWKANAGEEARKRRTKEKQNSQQLRQAGLLTNANLARTPQPVAPVTISKRVPRKPTHRPTKSPTSPKPNQPLPQEEKREKRAAELKRQAQIQSDANLAELRRAGELKRQNRLRKQRPSQQPRENPTESPATPPIEDPSEQPSRSGPPHPTDAKKIPIVKGVSLSLAAAAVATEISKTEAVTAETAVQSYEYKCTWCDPDKVFYGTFQEVHDHQVNNDCDPKWWLGWLNGYVKEGEPNGQTGYIPVDPTEGTSSVV